MTIKKTKSASNKTFLVFLDVLLSKPKTRQKTPMMIKKPVSNNKRKLAFIDFFSLLFINN